MALLKRKPNEIPSDAVILTEEQALSYSITLLKKWDTPSDVIAFKYGSYVLGAASFVTGLFINSHFRRKLYLHYYGRASTYLPICVLPSTLSTIIHMELVLKDLALQRGTCPICLELRSAALQSFFGTIFPYFLGISSSFALAHRYATYDIPYITQEPKKVINLVKKFTKPIKNVMVGIFFGQMMLASGVTYLEAKSVHTVHSKLAEMEKQVEQEIPPNIM